MTGHEEARAEVLARIRTALSTGASVPGGIPRGYLTGTAKATPALIELLTERLRDYGTSVRRCPADGVAQAVHEALAERGARRVVLPSGLTLGGPAPDGVEFLGDDGLSSEALDATDGVITTAAVAIAETGTIVLDAGPGQGRRALSLVPDYHLCILHASQIVGIVPQALERLDCWRAEGAEPLNRFLSHLSRRVPEIADPFREGTSPIPGLFCSGLLDACPGKSYQHARDCPAPNASSHHGAPCTKDSQVTSIVMGCRRLRHSPWENRLCALIRVRARRRAWGRAL